MAKENHNMTEWLKLERLDQNDLPLPKYESESSAGVDFSACLTRPCREVPEGATFKETRPFICCDPTVKGAYQHFKIDGATSLSPDLQRDRMMRNITSNKRMRVDPDSGWTDFLKAEKIRLTIFPGETVMVSLGYKCEFGSSYVLMLHVRSSVGMRGLELANQTGIIDPDYRGELWAVLYNRNKEIPIIIDHGDRLVQGVMLAFNQAIITETTVDKTNRGEGGFGSTGINVNGVLEADLQSQSEPPA